jgi:hypothetical protein
MIKGTKQNVTLLFEFYLGQVLLYEKYREDGKKFHYCAFGV